MPRICEFYGIVIRMFYQEEHGVPHFHARYGSAEATLAIGTLEVLGGTLPPRALRLVREWGRVRHKDLLENWDRARRHDPLVRVEPLP